MPHYKDADLPFVFCGLNWDASSYGLPYANVTGMVEVTPIPQIIRLLRSYAKGDRIGYLAEDTTTKRKELEYHERLFGIKYDQVYLVSTLRGLAGRLPQGAGRGRHAGDPGRRRDRRLRRRRGASARREPRPGSRPGPISTG